MPAYVLSPSAQRDLGHIRGYLSSAPEFIREREIDKLQACFAQVARFRQSGRLEPDLRSRTGEVRSILSYPYRIYYLPHAQPLSIVAVRDGRLQPLLPGTLM